MNHAQFLALLRTILDTRDDEIVCSEFFELLPKYVDLVLATADASRLPLGQPAEALPQVAHHILQCSECAEAYEALSRSNGPRGKIPRSAASNAQQEARESRQPTFRSSLRRVHRAS